MLCRTTLIFLSLGGWGPYWGNEVLRCKVNSFFLKNNAKIIKNNGFNVTFA